jgi:hypothetical protein
MKGNVRLRLDEPRAQQPSDLAVKQAVSSYTQRLINRVNNTGRAWTLQETTLNVAGGQDTYTLNVGSEYGKAINIYTVDESNPNHIERSIPFFETQNLQYDWGFPNNAGNWFQAWDGSNNTAMRMAISRSVEGDVVIRVLPTPQLSASYVVQYSTGYFLDTASLDTTVLLEQHHALPETQAALSLLSRARWSDDAKADRERRKDLAQSLQFDMTVFDRDFEDFIRAGFQARRCRALRR